MRPGGARASNRALSGDARQIITALPGSGAGPRTRLVRRSGVRPGSSMVMACQVNETACHVSDTQ